jgi:hypothetical protein
MHVLDILFDSFITDKMLTSLYTIRNQWLLEKERPMTLEFRVAIRVLDEYIEILKQELLFAMAERKPEGTMRMSQEIITIKRELDKAIQERMKLSHIYSSHNSSSVVAVPAAS